MASVRSLPSKTEEIFLFNCPACQARVSGEITLQLDTADVVIPHPSELNGGQATLQIAAKATRMVVSHDCKGVDTAAGRELAED